MKLLILITFLIPSVIYAKEIELIRGQKYKVPNGKVWVLKNAPNLECNVCTADVHVEGEVSNVEIGGVIFHGAFDFNIVSNKHETMKFFSGTIIWLGDSRPSLFINELDK